MIFLIYDFWTLIFFAFLNDLDLTLKLKFVVNNSMFYFCLFLQRSLGSLTSASVFSTFAATFVNVIDNARRINRRCIWFNDG
jgi:hypothetical protein